MITVEDSKIFAGTGFAISLGVDSEDFVEKVMKRGSVFAELFADFAKVSDSMTYAEFFASVADNASESNVVVHVMEKGELPHVFIVDRDSVVDASAASFVQIYGVSVADNDVNDNIVDMHNLAKELGLSTSIISTIVLDGNFS